MIDSHCHFDFPEFDSERDDIWRRCQTLGLRAMLIPGVHPKQWRQAQSLSSKYDTFYFSAGLHPWWINSARWANTQNKKKLFECITRFAESEPCVAIGECGLDSLYIKKTRCNADLEWRCQLDVLQTHIDLAKQCKKPIILHVVKAHADMLAVLKKAKLDFGGVVHAFSGSQEIAKQYCDLGFMLGIGGTITYDRAKQTRETVQKVPIDALLLETDAPSMPLFGMQGMKNSPEHLPLVAKTLAELRNLSLEEVSDYTTNNFYKVFNRSPIK